MLERHLEAQYVAMYRGRPEEGYALIHGVASAPEHLSADNELVLRLRRWNESFVNDERTDFFRGAYICAMTLRGSLRGFVACGPKRGRGKYLPDERDVLSALSHRVGSRSSC